MKTALHCFRNRLRVHVMYGILHAQSRNIQPQIFHRSDNFFSLNPQTYQVGMLDHMHNFSAIHAIQTKMWFHVQTNIQKHCFIIYLIVAELKLCLCLM